MRETRRVILPRMESFASVTEDPSPPDTKRNDKRFAASPRCYCSPDRDKAMPSSDEEDNDFLSGASVSAVAMTLWFGSILFTLSAMAARTWLLGDNRGECRSLFLFLLLGFD